MSVLRENFSACNLKFLKFNIPLMALTATATIPVRGDVLKVLSMSKETKVVLTSFFRPNLRFSVICPPTYVWIVVWPIRAQLFLFSYCGRWKQHPNLSTLIWWLQVKGKKGIGEKDWKTAFELKNTDFYIAAVWLV